jgi:hypothetical protein
MWAHLTLLLGGADDLKSDDGETAMDNAMDAGHEKAAYLLAEERDKADLQHENEWIKRTGTKAAYFLNLVYGQSDMVDQFSIFSLRPPPVLLLPANW